MVEIRPFRGIRFNPEVAGDISPALCPTFVLSPAEQQEMYARSPYNVIRLELAYDWGTEATNGERYRRAAETRDAWLRDGVLVQDETPSIYVAEERFTYRNGRYRRIGLIAAVRVDDYDTRTVLPHEATEPGPVADRLALMKATRANFSPLMTLYRDDRNAPIASILWRVARRAPDIEANPADQAAIRAWRVVDSQTINALRDAFHKKRLYIADGHHRYGAALAYRAYAQEDLGHGPGCASAFRMMCLFDFDDPGLFLLGYHRAVEGASEAELERLRERIRETCDLREFTPHRADPTAAVEQEIEREDRSLAVFGIVGLKPGAFHIATMRGHSRSSRISDQTDYGRLHREIFEQVFDAHRELHAVTVKHNAGQAVTDVLAGRSQVSFVMRPVPEELAESVIDHGELLPVKSTFFHPKVSAGLVMQSLEGEI